MASTGITARIRAALGWATADRREEAKGRLEELDQADPAHAPGPGADHDDLLDEAELHVRADHGDLAPSAEPDGRQPASPPEPG